MKKNSFEKAIFAEIEWCQSHKGFCGNNQEDHELGFISGLKQAILIIRSVENCTFTLKT